MKVWRLCAYYTNPMTGLETWTKTWDQSPESSKRPHLRCRLGWGCFFFCQEDCLWASLLYAKDPTIRFLIPWLQVCFQKKLLGYISFGMLTKKKTRSNSFLVMNLRTKEINRRSSSNREKTKGKPIIRDSYEGLVLSALKGMEDTGHENKHKARPWAHGGPFHL